MATLEKYVASHDRTLSVNFVCQRCCQPLKIHSSFNDIDDQTFSDLLQPLSSNFDNDDYSSFVQPFQKTVDSNNDDVSRKIVFPLRLTESGNGFTVIGDLLSSGVENFSHSLKVTATLFDILSDQSDVDHPLCEECTDNLLDQQDQQLKICEDECEEYREFLENLSNCSSDEDDLEKLQDELKQLQDEVVNLQKELCEIENKEKSVKDILHSCEEEREKLQREEDRYWQEYSKLKRQILSCEDDQRSVDIQIRYAQAQLDKLKKTNIFNATFHIWHNGHFGTINNFRLGRLPSVPVDWAEINAAWGQTALLLHSLAKKIDLTFQRYRLVPYGNHSYLECLNDKSKELPLYFCGGLRYLWDTRFDQAMAAFLDCLQQFKEKVEKSDTTFHLPYKMDNDKILDTTAGKTYCIKIQFNSEEQWTKALKFMLTNLKWALAWVSSQFANNT